MHAPSQTPLSRLTVAALRHCTVSRKKGKWRRAECSQHTPVAGVLIWHAVAGTSNCYDVGHVGGPEGPWDPVDQVVKEFADGNPR